MNNKVFFHEDFYRQIELIPEENFFSTSRIIDDFTPKENSTYGIYDISVRPEQKIRLLDRLIPIEGIRRILTPISLFYSEEIETGYGRTVFKAEDTVVWGFERYGIFVKENNSYVEAIWLCNSSLFPFNKTATFLNKALFDLATYYSLIIVDWNKEIVCRTTSEQSIKEYLIQNLAFIY